MRISQVVGGRADDTFGVSFGYAEISERARKRDRDARLFAAAEAVDPETGEFNYTGRAAGSVQRGTDRSHLPSPNCAGLDGPARLSIRVPAGRQRPEPARSEWCCPQERRHLRAAHHHPVFTPRSRPTRPTLMPVRL